MDDSQLLRYSRHILLRQVDIAGQEKLLHARVLIIGLGGLGSPVTMYLAASGVGHLVIVDHDKVELTNLQRQIVHTTASIGESKATSATRQLKALNPDWKKTSGSSNARLRGVARRCVRFWRILAPRTVRQLLIATEAA